MLELHEQLEGRWSDKFGGYCVACSSGTAALHLALEALSIRGKVAVPDFTMIACARACTLAGATPVFVDCRTDLLIDPNQIPAVDAIMPVHIYGRGCDMDAIAGLGKVVVEDLAECHGREPHEATAAACWSFYRNKVVHGEEGGMIRFRESQAANAARRLRSMGMGGKDPYQHLPRGHNYRMSDAHSELVLNSMDEYSATVLRRRKYEAEYTKSIPEYWVNSHRESPWVFDVRVPGATREEMLAAARASNGRPGFLPMTMQDEYRGQTGPNAAKASEEVFYMPLVRCNPAKNVLAAMRALERLGPTRHVGP